MQTNDNQTLRDVIAQAVPSLSTAEQLKITEAVQAFFYPNQNADAEQEPDWQTNHTHGPWRVKSKDLDTFLIHTDDIDIAEVMAIGGEGLSEEGEANAHLIARSPHMLAMLKKIAAAFPELDTDEPMEGSETISTLCALWPEIKSILNDAN